VFIILSPAFDSRFYQTTPPSNLRREIGNAIGHFSKIIHAFSQKFTILVDGEVIVPWYIVNRMLGEFAAAAVFLSQSIADGDNLTDESRLFSVQEAIECILKDHRPEIMAYYSHCIEQRHQSFLWTGPQVDILPSSSSLLAVLSESTSGTLLDLPGHSIYKPLSPDVPPLVGKRRDHDSPGSSNGATRKRKRRL
jgi:hypothetical protein